MLIVARDPDLRDAVREIAEDIGFDARSVGSCAEARVVEHGLSLAFVDVGLEPAEAGALLADLAARDSAPAIVLCSDRPAGARLAERFGVVSIRKPFDVDELVDASDLALRERRRPRLAG